MKLEIPRGYRLVKSGQLVQQGDLIFSTYFKKREWRKTVKFGYPAVDSESVSYIRRDEKENQKENR